MIAQTFSLCLVCTPVLTSETMFTFFCSITKVASVTKRPDKVIGMHFFNPVPVMKVIELVPGKLINALHHVLSVYHRDWTEQSTTLD